MAASLQSQYMFPHFPPPPSPAGKPPSPPHSHGSPPPPSSHTRPSQPPPHIIVPPPHAVPPPSPPHLVPPPPHTLAPPPHTFPPPPPRKIPPPPHTFPPPPPHTIPPPSPPHMIPPPPPPSPGNHTTIIIVVFVSCGGVFFLAFIMAALWCFLKKKRKTVQKAENVHIDEHRTVKESIVQGPHGTENVMLSVEDDIHIEEDIRKSEIENFRKGLHLNSGLNIDAGKPSSSTGDHHHGQKL